MSVSPESPADHTKSFSIVCMANTRTKTKGSLFRFLREHERSMHLWWRRRKYEDTRIAYNDAYANFKTVNLKCFTLLESLIGFVSPDFSSEVDMSIPGMI